MLKQLPQSSKGELERLENKIKNKKTEIETTKSEHQVILEVWDVFWIWMF